VREDSASPTWLYIVAIAHRTALSLLPIALQREVIASINHLIYFMLTVWAVMTFKHIDSFFTTNHILLNNIMILVDFYVHLGSSLRVMLDIRPP
jgi:uncharacterized membrane protein YwzB